MSHLWKNEAISALIFHWTRSPLFFNLLGSRKLLSELFQMEKKRKMQLALILAVALLTIYNILPTLFFYAQPLKSAISPAIAAREAETIALRVDSLEKQSIEWLGSYCNLLEITPQSINITDNHDLISLEFPKTEEAEKFKKFFPRAGSFIAFVPAQLSLASSENPKTVIVQRKIDLHLDGNAFQFVPKFEGAELSSQYRAICQDRAAAIRDAALAPTPLLADADPLLSSSSSILDISKFYEINPMLAKRLAVHRFHSVDITSLQDSFVKKREELKKKSDERQELKLAAAGLFLKKHTGLFTPLSLLSIGDFEQSFDFSQHHPFFCTMELDTKKNAIHLSLHPDVAMLLSSDVEEKYLLEQLLIDEAAKIAHLTNEKIIQTPFGYTIALQEMEEVSGLLVLQLDRLAKKCVNTLASTIKNQWHPRHPDLVDLPILTESEYSALPPQQKTLCLVLSAPVAEKSTLSPSLQNRSIYVVVKGINHVLRTYENALQSEISQTFLRDFQSLAELLNRFGFSSHLGSHWKEFSQDFLFEKKNYYDVLLTATRENFHVFGSKKTAILELSDFEQRLLTRNKIETQIHEDLVKWNDEYLASKVSLNPSIHFDFPKPTQSIFWNNLKLTFAKMLRGDERKIIRWGLDLSGGKTVQIELRDQYNRAVTEETDIKQGINELFDRVNKMGVSDVSIRQMGHHIVLDFPGGQALLASDLVTASSMYFHIVNETFSPWNASLAASSDRFLTEVWNEAVVSNKKDPDHVQLIAYRHLHGESPSEAAKALLENGLRLAHPKDISKELGLDETLSKIALFRGNETEGQRHPLLIVFKNAALEGANLENIRASYDPSKGNFLSFEVKKGLAQQQLFAWTSAFSKERVIGTAREVCSQGRGWRMAVVLNDRMISAPTLESALKDGGSISGSFSQREVNQLAADLKAGSLTFTPHILAEKNVSPELGKSDRTKGIMATIVALFLVMGAMIAYYRFAGLIAIGAVFFNLLIMWAVLQNLGASLSLASIAGIILTVGMAVDANVLVFERMKEEFAHSKNIASAIRTGYEKAFSAIVDSNVTTVIAAIILLNFDAGPIKAFAISMIIGIISSMFTALFVTRFYFNGWVKKSRSTVLKMANWIRHSNYNFLKKAPLSFSIAAIVIVTGGMLLAVKRSTLFGMDFTGGYALPIETIGHFTSEEIEQALQKQGAASTDVHVRQLSSNQFEILLGTTMEQPGKPFYAPESERKAFRINWVVHALRQFDIHLTNSSQTTLESNWTAMSGQMSESMRNNALLGLGLAFLGIFIYISFRFEYKYAIATLLCLFHDVLITLGSIGILHALKMPVQIDLNTIAALMTIIGYSLNDTIIIFDRIREDVRLYPSQPMGEIVNCALNTTLSRTAITSGTTLLVLLALLIFGGVSMFNFSLVMVIGVIFGTLSSWFIASPLMLLFHAKESVAKLSKASS
jgi:SecD/SecF fusion protein